jgi:hypothetical protein
MATYSRREITQTRIDFIVPTTFDRGAMWVEVMKAISAATSELRKFGGAPETGDPSDDAIWIRPGDQDVIVSYYREQAVTDRSDPS